MNLTSSIKDFRNILQALLVEDSFRRNFAITFSAQAFGQLVGFMFTPFIARVYGPESYGIFSLFMAIAANLSSVSTMQLPTGYVSARTHREFHVLFQLTFLSLIIFSLVCALAIFIFKDSILYALDAYSLSFLIYLVPSYVLFMGIDYMLLGWNIYLKEFGRGAVAKISSIVLSKGVTLLYGAIVASSAIGLVVGNFLIYPLESTIKFSRTIRSDLLIDFKLASWAELKSVLMRYKSYPIFVTPGLMVSSLNSQLPLYFFSIYFQNAYVGLFALASSVIAVPISVLTNSTTTVFLQKAAETQRAHPDSLKELVFSLFKRLFLICFVPLTAFAFLSDWIFVFIFGEAWEQAGWIAAFLSVSMILSVSQQPLAVLFRLMDKEHKNLILNILSVVMRVLALSIGYYVGDIKIAVACFAAASILTTSLSLGLIFTMVKIKTSRLSYYVLAVLAVLALVVFQKI